MRPCLPHPPPYHSIGPYYSKGDFMFQEVRFGSGQHLQRLATNAGNPIDLPNRTLLRSCYVRIDKQIGEPVLSSLHSGNGTIGIGICQQGGPTPS
ncbi:hypothetical protein SUGI_1522710 [Cryptomeria japonica]|uniref:Uncharacterized protein n=1 Tax=Cryptomeria japonica TaxID=3369 RepID=A0AAD3NU34_CRYJA|nr:hypothetical protein SUGI_1499770 [Cryptomeria japonica]GLJ59776.1 hypothetical protein SUGI_1522710 [Cryptomeria japonica]